MSKSITISHTIDPGSMGDWPADQDDVAESFAAYLTEKWSSQAADLPELEGYDVTIDVDVAPSCGDSFAALTTEGVEFEEGFEIESELREEFDSNQHWEAFCCDSDYARSFDE